MSDEEVHHVADVETLSTSNEIPIKSEDVIEFVGHEFQESFLVVNGTTEDATKLNEASNNFVNGINSETTSVGVESKDKIDAIDEIVLDGVPKKIVMLKEDSKNRIDAADEIMLDGLPKEIVMKADSKDRKNSTEEIVLYDLSMLKVDSKDRIYAADVSVLGGVSNEFVMLKEDSKDRIDTADEIVLDGVPKEIVMLKADSKGRIDSTEEIVSDRMPKGDVMLKAEVQIYVEDVVVNNVDGKEKVEKTDTSGIEFEFIPTISQLFRGKDVFITGARGFVGKVLLYKLLRSCPGIRHVFVLLRPKGSKDAETMLADLFSTKLFNLLRTECPGVLTKVTPLSGDVSSPDFGLPDKQLQRLVSEVSFVFHCAANVRFDEQPRKCLNDNLMGVKHVLDVCHKMKNLKAVVHVSTAYGFCNRTEIGETIYKDSVQSGHIMDSLKWMTDSQLEAMCKHYLISSRRPSLYHLSKALAENLIEQNKPPLPVIIVRPSIVTAAWKEPLPGWIDNYNGPSGLIALCNKGIVRSVLVQPDVTADWVPVDVVANTLIASAHSVALDRQNKGVPVINCTVPWSNNLTWGEVEELCFPLLLRYPSLEVFRHPGGSFKTSRTLHGLSVFFTHLLPACIFDIFGLLIFRRPRMLSLYGRIHGVMSHLEYFTNRQFNFQTANMTKLIDDMLPEDKVVFYNDLRDLDWTEYMESYVLGVRRYFLKEDDQTLAEARRKMNKMYYVWLSIHAFSIIGALLLMRKCASPSLLESYGQAVYRFFRIPFLSQNLAKYFGRRQLPS